MSRLLLLATLGLVLTLSIEAVSQVPQPSIKPADPESRSQSRTTYVLEVAYNSALPPAYIQVQGTESKPRWIWVTRFAMTPGWQYPEDVLPIRAVKFEAQYNGETADVRVTLFRGRQSFEQEDLVDTFHLGLDDPRTVTKLKDFGVEPARIQLLNPSSVQPLWPGVSNNTTSIVVEKISMENDSLPGYSVVFRNLSDKPLAALKVDVSKDNRGPTSAFFQGEDGNALIQSGGTSEQYLPVVIEVVLNNPSSPVQATPNTIMIRSAVFADGTYEGDREPACMFEGFQRGRKIWLTTVLPLFEQQLSEETLPAPQLAAAFKQKLLSLPFQLQLTAPPKTNSCAFTPQDLKVSVNGQKLLLLRELDRIIATRPAPPVDFKKWLQATADRYRAWLARL